MQLLYLPFISERQKYALIYPELNEREKRKWRVEVEGILRFTKYCVSEVVQKVKGKEEAIFQENDWEQFKNIYTPESFRNNYKQRKDFSSSDFTALMRELDEYNALMLEKIKKFIESNTPV